MATEGSNASNVLEEALLTLESEFAELEQEYGADLEQESMIADVENSPVVPDEGNDLEEASTSLSPELKQVKLTYKKIARFRSFFLTHVSVIWGLEIKLVALVYHFKR